MTAKKWLDSIEKQKRSNFKGRDRQTDRQRDRQTESTTKNKTPGLGAEIKNRHIYSDGLTLAVIANNNSLSNPISSHHV